MRNEHSELAAFAGVKPTRTEPAAAASSPPDKEGGEPGKARRQ